MRRHGVAIQVLSLHNEASRTAGYLSSGWINLCDGSRRVRVSAVVKTSASLEHDGQQRVDNGVARPLSRRRWEVALRPYQPFQRLLQTLEADVETKSVAADRKSTRLNSSHLGISYAVFCL